MQIEADPSFYERIDESLGLSETADALLNGFFFALPEDALKRIKKKISIGYSVVNAYRSESLPFMSQEEKEAYADVQVGYGLDEILLFDESTFVKNPYYRLLEGLEEEKVGHSRFGQETIKAYTLFVYDEVRETRGDPLATYSPIAAFRGDYKMPVIKRGDRIFMSLHPHEIATMRKPLEKAHGKVLTYGLGLGYFAFMAAEKPEVESVTVVENDPAAIALFKKVLLPRFPRRDKITIIQDNALNFAKGGEKGEFDYLFVDIYFDAEDALPLYLQLVKTEGRAKTTDYWIEKAILAYFRRHVATFLLEQGDGYGAEQYRGYENFSERLLCSLFSYYKNARMKEEEAKALLEEENLKALAKNLTLVP